VQLAGLRPPLRCGGPRQHDLAGPTLRRYLDGAPASEVVGSLSHRSPCDEQQRRETRRRTGESNRRGFTLRPSSLSSPDGNDVRVRFMTSPCTSSASYQNPTDTPSVAKHRVRSAGPANSVPIPTSSTVCGATCRQVPTSTPVGCDSPVCTNCWVKTSASTVVVKTRSPLASAYSHYVLSLKKYAAGCARRTQPPQDNLHVTQ